MHADDGPPQLLLSRPAGEETEPAGTISHVPIECTDDLDVRRRNRRSVAVDNDAANNDVLFHLRGCGLPDQTEHQGETKETDGFNSRGPLGCHKTLSPVW